MLSKKHYVAIAAILKGQGHQVADEAAHLLLFRVADNLSYHFKADNPNFDYGRFIAACGFNEDGTRNDT